MPPLERDYPVEGPLDLRRTLRSMLMWGGSTWMRIDDSGAWYARRCKAGPATVQLRRRDRFLVARSWGDGSDELLDSVPDLCGLGNQGLADVVPQSPRVRDMLLGVQGYRQARSGQVLPQLVCTALGQKVTGKNSSGAIRRIAYWWGEKPPGPRDDLRILPLPRDLERRPYYEYSRLGIERKRADLVRRIASRSHAMQRAAKMPFAEARAHLEKLPGIGPWTSGVVMGGVLGDPDAVPIGDYHLPNYVGWTLAREPRATDQRMMELLEPYAGHRGMVARAVKVGGDTPPKWGPRMTPQDLRDLS
ncbi:MAG: DNA-3-methyladenine glycosylase 2 family protein [Deltaproteobacteria bacterium]|nr:DNA-3-methyladenine glycosylase 2 family protein [Deltaproteobacteria bacterium]